MHLASISTCLRKLLRLMWGHFHFWKTETDHLGLGPAVSMEELAEIRKRTDLRSEAFWSHVLFLIPDVVPFLTTCLTGMPTVVAVPQSCRWKPFSTMPFGQERKSIKGKSQKEYSMSAVDMCMIENIPID